MKDYRAIPVEVLRDFALSQTETSSIRDVADQIGISHSALYKFVTGRTAPQPRTRRLLGLWYLDATERADELDVARPYAASLGMLLAGLPEPLRTRMEEKVLADLADGYTHVGPPPRWLEVLLRWRRRSQAQNS